MRWALLAAMLACGRDFRPIPPECLPSSVCPRAEWINLDAGAPELVYSDGGRFDVGGGYWWLCWCGVSGGYFYRAPGSWSGAPDLAYECGVYAAEWANLCPP